MRELKQQLDDIHDRFPNLKPDELFVVWFLRAYITDNEQDSVQALAGACGDQGVDALIIDDIAHGVFIVQGKYRQRLFLKNESRTDVMCFAQLACTLADDDEAAFSALCANANAEVSDRLKHARRRIKNDDYKLWLYYASLGKFSHRLQQQANQSVVASGCNAAIEIFDGRRLMHLLRDYLDGVAPPIPTLDLEMEVGSGVNVKGVLQRYDSHNDVDCWVITMRGDSIARIYQQSGLRLFARNIRGFLGDSTPVNRGMAATLRDEADHFFYYNNGITILCDRAERLTSRGSDFLRVSNPQIINGQQTTRVLAGEPGDAARASVLVKVMQVPRNAECDTDGFDDLLSRIVAGTNWQNAISPSDLMSNDRTQIELERNLRKFGYLYLRKRQTKGDAKRSMGAKGYIAVKKTEMAQVIAGCDLDPAIVRAGKENLFEEEMYRTIFPNSDPLYYLPRYWLTRDVAYAVKGRRDRIYSKWLVLNFLWLQLGASLRQKKNAEAFQSMHLRQEWNLLLPLSRAIDDTFKVSIDMYRRARRTAKEQLDLPSFFKVRGRHREFEVFWSKPINKRRRVIENNLRRAEENIVEYQNR